VTALHSAPASFIDQAFALMQTPTRGFDFGLVLYLPKPPRIEELNAGAARAFARYPKSACTLYGSTWQPMPGVDFQVHTGDTPGDTLGDEDTRIAELMQRPFTPGRELLIRQFLVRKPGAEAARLLTQVHHALGDFISLAAWLSCQLGGAGGTENFTTTAALTLKSHESAERKSQFAFSRPCHAIRLGRAARPSAVRGSKTIAFVNTAIKAAVRTRATFSYNDLLSAIAMATLRDWNSAHGGARDRIGLWIPINIRRAPYAGFGNGASRIRIYDRSRAGSTYAARATELRAQMSYSRAHGEWHAPDLTHTLGRWPKWLARTLLRLYAARPGVDYATTTFSHIEAIGAAADEQMLPGVSGIEAFGNLYGGHTLGFAAIGFAEKTFVSFTWDSALYSAEDIAEFIALFEKHRAHAFSELVT
jgi:hypothetical protein